MLVNCAKLKAGCRSWAGENGVASGVGNALAMGLLQSSDAEALSIGPLRERRGKGKRWAEAIAEVEGEGDALVEPVRGLALSYEVAGHVLSTAAEGYLMFGLDGGAQKFMVRTAAAGTGQAGVSVPEGVVVAVGFVDFKEKKAGVVL